MVREEDRITKEKHEKNNEKLVELVGKRPKFEKDQWVLVYDDKSTISGGGEHVLKGDNARGGKSFALVSKLALDWTGPYKVLFVGPGKAPDGRQVGPKLLLLDINNNEPGRGINPRVTRCRFIGVRYVTIHMMRRKKNQDFYRGI